MWCGVGSRVPWSCHKWCRLGIKTTDMAGLRGVLQDLSPPGIEGHPPLIHLNSHDSTCRHAFEIGVQLNFDVIRDVGFSREEMTTSRRMAFVKAACEKATTVARQSPSRRLKNKNGALAQP